MFKVICVGNIKETYLKDAIKEYLKRISKYTKIDIIELPDTPIIEKALLKEKKLIQKNINDKDYVIALDIKGTMLSSEELSENLSKIMAIHNGNVVFVIGGSYGLHAEVLKRANYRLSFSKLTFPHQLFRVVLLEQIYRCFKIINNESYHK